MLGNEAAKLYGQNIEEWTNILEQLQNEEDKKMQAERSNLRNYLMRYVFPTLTEGLKEVVTVRPDDPVDYLAEFLFKQNPEGHMLDPSYSSIGELLTSYFKDKPAGDEKNPPKQNNMQ